MTDLPLITPVPGKPALLLGGFEIGSLGYVAEEFFLSGTAASYAATGCPIGMHFVTSLPE